MEKDIFKLQLHETTKIRGMRITCVSGGWIYMREEVDSGSVSSVFVPYDTELKTSKNK